MHAMRTSAPSIIAEHLRPIPKRRRPAAGHAQSTIGTLLKIAAEREANPGAVARWGCTDIAPVS
jgi:hypothetical protein